MTQDTLRAALLALFNKVRAEGSAYCADELEAAETALAAAPQAAPSVQVAASEEARQRIRELSDEDIAAWADSFIVAKAFNRPIAVQIATEAAKWVRAKHEDTIANLVRALAEEVNGPTFMGEPALASSPQASPPQPEYPEAAEVCAEAYQAVGILLDQVGQFESEHGQKLLDNLSEHRLVHKDVLPWPALPQRPDLLEKLTYHALERDDMSIDDALEYLANGWRKVHGRTERQMVLQLLALMSAQPDRAPPEAAAVPVAWRYRFHAEGTWTLSDKPSPRSVNPNFEEQPLYAAPPHQAQGEPTP